MSLNNTQNNTNLTLNKFFDDMKKIQLNNHPNKNYYIENYEYVCCQHCGYCYEEEDYDELVVCNTCNHLHCKDCYYKYYDQDRCIKCYTEKQNYNKVIRFFKDVVEEVIEDGFILKCNVEADFSKPESYYKFSNLMRILFNEYKIEFWDDDERRLKDRTNALLVFKNMKKYIPHDIQRHLITNYL